MKKILPKKRMRTAPKLKKQRPPFQKRVSFAKSSPDTKKAQRAEEFVKTGIVGFDALLDQGIPKSTSVLVAVGTGTGKTIFCLQTLCNAAKK